MSDGVCLTSSSSSAGAAAVSSSFPSSSSSSDASAAATTPSLDSSVSSTSRSALGSKETVFFFSILLLNTGFPGLARSSDGNNRGSVGRLVIRISKQSRHSKLLTPFIFRIWNETSIECLGVFVRVSLKSAIEFLISLIESAVPHCNGEVLFDLEEEFVVIGFFEGKTFLLKWRKTQLWS